MLTSVERNAVQAFSKGNHFLPHCVASCWRFSLDNLCFRFMTSLTRALSTPPYPEADQSSPHHAILTN
jgi:hypothetical protein